VTKDEFFQCLRDSRDKFVWTISGFGKIRGILLDQCCNSKVDLFCPITAVCFLTIGNKYNVLSFIQAANDLELAEELKGVVNASDQVTGINMKLRHEIEEAVFGKVVTK
jgi:hypothetical protein